MTEVPAQGPQSLRSGYKEEQHLVVVHRAHETCHCNEEKEDTHSNDSSNNVNAGHQTQALAPGSHADEQ